MLSRPLPIAAYLFFTLALSLLAACHKDESGTSSDIHQKVLIRVNESADELNKNNPGQLQHTSRPPGVDFYFAHWDAKFPGLVAFEHGAHSFTFCSALSVTGSDDPNFPDENILDWKINAGVSDEDLIGHDEARRKFFNILRGLRNAGWSRWISPSEPRLKAIDVMTQPNLLTLCG